MPKCVNSYSPFVLRVRPGRRQEESGSVVMLSIQACVAAIKIYEIL